VLPPLAASTVQSPVLLAAVLVITVLLVVMATGRGRVHPLLALLAAAYGAGLAGGLPAADVGRIIADGFGDLLASIGLVIIAGTLIGTVLERSGGALVLADRALGIVGNKHPALAMNLVGYIVSIPVFCDSGFLVLSPLNRAIAARTGVSIAVLTVALATGLYATHVFVPPTPGPLAAAAALGVNLAPVVGLGLVVALPVALTGLAWGHLVDRYGRGLTTSLAPNYVRWEDLVASHGSLPSATTALTPVLVPLVLISASSLLVLAPPESVPSWLAAAGQLVGFPATAMLIGAVCGLLLHRKHSDKATAGWVRESLREAAGVIAITGAGGALGAVLSALGIGRVLGEGLAALDMGVLVPFVVASALKIAQGSSTVSMVTTAAIVAPLASALGFGSETGRVLLVLAIAAGSMVTSHVNDSYFWVVSQGAGLPVATAYRAHTLATFAQGVVGIVVVWLLSLVLL